MVDSRTYKSEDPGFDPLAGQGETIAPCYDCSLSPGESSPNAPCIVSRQESYLIQYNTLIYNIDDPILCGVSIA